MEGIAPRILPFPGEWVYLVSFSLRASSASVGVFRSEYKNCPSSLLNQFATQVSVLLSYLNEKEINAFISSNKSSSDGSCGIACMRDIASMNILSKSTYTLHTQGSDNVWFLSFWRTSILGCWLCVILSYGLVIQLSHSSLLPTMQLLHHFFSRQFCTLGQTPARTSSVLSTCLGRSPVITEYPWSRSVMMICSRIGFVSKC